MVFRGRKLKIFKLKFLKNQKLGFLYFRAFGLIKLFRQDFNKEDSRDYILYLPDQEALNQITKSEFVTIHDTHWGIESFHRAIKQVCGICRFMVRDSQGIETQIFCSLQAFVRLETMRSENIISNWYELQRNLFTLVVRDYIVENLTNIAAAYYPWTSFFVNAQLLTCIFCIKELVNFIGLVSVSLSLYNRRIMTTLPFRSLLWHLFDMNNIGFRQEPYYCCFTASCKCNSGFSVIYRNLCKLLRR